MSNIYWKGRRKGMNHRQAFLDVGRKAIPLKIKNPYGNKDGDNKVNKFDCQPLNKRKQDEIKVINDPKHEYPMSFNRRDKILIRNPKMADDKWTEEKLIPHELGHYEYDKGIMGKIRKFRDKNLNPDFLLNRKIEKHLNKRAEQWAKDIYKENKLNPNKKEKEKHLTNLKDRIWNKTLKGVSKENMRNEIYANDIEFGQKPLKTKWKWDKEKSIILTNEDIK